MYYLTQNVGSWNVNDDVVILAGDLINFLDDGSVSASGPQAEGLTLIGDNRELMLCGNRSDAFISLLSYGTGGTYAAVRFAGRNASINFAALGGGASRVAVADDQIRITASETLGTSLVYPNPSYSAIVGIFAQEKLTSKSDFSGVVDSVAATENDGYQALDGTFIEASSGGAIKAYGVQVGSDFAVAGNFTGTVSSSSSSKNISTINLAVTSAESIARGLNVANGVFSVAGVFDGNIMTTGANEVYARLADYKQNKETLPGNSATISNAGISVIGIDAKQALFNNAWNGRVWVQSQKFTVTANLVKVGASDSKKWQDPPLSDVKVSANNGTLDLYGVKSPIISVKGNIGGCIEAYSTAFSVTASGTGKNTDSEISNWKVNVVGINGTSMAVDGNFGGVVNAISADVVFRATSNGQRTVPEVKDEKVSTSSYLKNNVIKVIGVEVDRLTVNGGLSAAITARGSFVFSATAQGGNSQNLGEISDNKVTIAGILSNNLTALNGISSSIVVHGEAGVQWGGGGRFNVPTVDYRNNLGVYGIKTETLIASKFTGSITVTSEDLDTAQQGNTNLKFQTVGIYATDAINGGSPDVALTISGNIVVKAEAGVAVGILRSFSEGYGSLNVCISGNVDVRTGSGSAYAIHVGDVWSSVKYIGGKSQSLGNSITHMQVAVDDRVEIAAGGYVLGSMELSTGTNHVTIDSRGQMDGDLITTGGTLNLKFNLVGTEKADQAILITNTDFRSTACSISTFTVELNEAVSGAKYTLLQDRGGAIDSKWYGRTISLHYNGETIITRVGHEGLNDYSATVNGLAVKVYITADGGNIVAEVGEKAIPLSVGPGFAVGETSNPVIAGNSATFSWQDMSVKYDGTGENINAGYVLTEGGQINRYEIEISASADFSRSISRYVLGDNLGYAETSITIDGFSAGDYYWRVRTFYSDGSQSEWSSPAGSAGSSAGNQFTVTDQIIYSTPAAIAVDSMTAKDPNTPTNHYNNSTVLLDWADSSSATGIDHYVVEYIESINQSDFYLAAQAGDVLGEDGTVTAQGWDSWLAANPGVVQSRIVSASELLLTGLANFSNLHFRIKAVANDLGLYPNGETPNLEGEWAYYDKSVVVWVGDQAAPTNPSDLTLTVTNPQYPSEDNPEAPRTADASVTWSKSLDHQSGVQKYVVEYLVATDGEEVDWSGASVKELSGNKDNIVPALRFDLPGLVENAADQSYYWRVKAVDYAGNEGEWAYGDTFKIDLTDPTDPVPGKVTVEGTTEGGATGMTFTWTASSDASPLAYSLWISTQADFSELTAINLEIKGTLVDSTVSYTLTAKEFGALTNNGYTFADGTTYYWQIQAFDSPVGADYHNKSKVVDGSFTVDLADDTPPDVPQNFTASQVSGERSISVTWDEAHDNKAAGILRYELKYRTDSSLDWNSVPTITVSDALSYRLSNAIEGAGYQWVIRAVDMAGNIGEWSEIATVICDVTPPSVPAGKLNVTVNATKNGGPSVDFSWGSSVDNVDGTNVSYVMQFSKDYRFSIGSTVETITVTARFDAQADTTRFYLGTQEIGSLVNGNVKLTLSGDILNKFDDFSRYYFRVQAKDTVGNKSGFTGSSSTYFDAPDKEAPTQPEDLRMQRVAGSNKITLSWKASSDNDTAHVLGYKVSYWTKDDKSDLIVIDNIAGTSTAVELPEGMVSWTVEAVDFAGNHSIPSDVKEGVVDYQAPNQPENLTSRIDGRAITLSWEAPDPVDPAPSSGLGYYEIRYSTDSNYMSTVTVLVKVDSTNTQYTLAADLLPDNVSYYWSVRAVDNVGNASAWKNGIYFTTPDTTNNPEDAFPLELGSAVTERVGGVSDPGDFYCLELAETGKYKFSLDAGNPNVALKLQLIGADGKVTNITYRAGQEIDLVAGEYRLGVTFGSASVVYTLSSEQLAAYDIHNGDDDMKTTDRSVTLTYSEDGAQATGSYTDWVGFGDTTDSYKLVITDAGSFQFTVNGLDANATVTLYNEKFATQSGWSMTAKPGADSTLAGKLLMPGTYYIKVDRTGSTNTDYTVSITGDVFPVDNQDDTAVLVDQLLVENPTDKHQLTVSDDGVVSSYSDWVGYGDKDDFYKFTLDSKGTYSVNIGDLSNRVTVTLWAKDANGRLVSKNSYGFAPVGSVNSKNGPLVNLEAGEYYIQISAPDSNTGKNTNYTVTVDGESYKPGEDDNAFDTAWVTDNALSSSTSFESGFSDWVGFGDTEDFRLLGTAQGAVSFTATLDIANAATLYVYQVAADGTALKQLITLTPRLTFNADGSRASISGDRLTVNCGSELNSTEYKYYYKVVSTGAGSGKNTDYTLDTVGGKNAVNNADDKLASATEITPDGFGHVAEVVDGGIGYGDTADYFKLVLTLDGQYGFSIDGLDASNYNGVVTLKLLSATGAQLKTVSVDLSKGNTAGSLVSEMMAAGTYYLYVTGSASAGFTGYTLNAEGAYKPASTNNSRAEAAELVFSQEVAPMRATVVDPTQVRCLTSNASGWVGRGDTVDFYSFTADSEGRYDFSLRGIDGAAKLTIYTKSFNALGQEIASVAVGSVLTGGTGNKLSLLLTSGDYYVEISSNGKTVTDTNYYLDAKAETFGSLTVDGTTELAFDGAGEKTYRFDWIGGNLSLSVGGEAKDLSYALYHQVGNRLVEIKAADAAGSLDQAGLAAGTYFVKVRHEGSAAANFDLEFEVDEVAPRYAGCALDIESEPVLSGAPNLLPSLDGRELSQTGIAPDSGAVVDALQGEDEVAEALKRGMLA